MTTTLKHALSTSVIVFFVILALASATGKNVTVSKESGQIPPNFEPMKETLLVIKNSMSGIGVGNTFKSAFKDYNAPYLFIKDTELDSYNKDKYKFVLFLSHNSSNFSDANGRPGPGTVSCVIKDRNTGKEYVSTGVPDFGHLLKNYVKSLNQLIK
jgi:hypothetical protein